MYGKINDAKKRNDNLSRRTSLPESLVQRITAFKEILSEVDNMSLEEVVADFTRDAHPEREIAIWERIASTYQIYLTRNPTDDPRIKHDVFSVLLMTSLRIENWDGIQHLTPDQIRLLVLNYRGL